MYVVTVKFTTSEADFSAFLGHITENARKSVADEPDCLQFDVCVSDEIPNSVFLYEVYTDATAFDAHMDSPHFQQFTDVAGGMVTAKTVQTYHQLR